MSRRHVIPLLAIVSMGVVIGFILMVRGEQKLRRRDSVRYAEVRWVAGDRPDARLDEIHALAIYDTVDVGRKAPILNYAGDFVVHLVHEDGTSDMIGVTTAQDVVLCGNRPVIADTDRIRRIVHDSVARKRAETLPSFGEEEDK